MNKDLEKRLKNYCEENSGQFRTMYYEENDNIVVVKEYAGHGFPEVVNTFYNEKMLENWLGKVDDLEKRLKDSSDEFYHEILIKLSESEGPNCTRWGIYFNDEEEITMLFDEHGNFERFEDEADQEKYIDEVQNWEIGNWKDFDIKGIY